MSAHLFNLQPVLNQQCYARIQITNILLEDKVAFRLRGDFDFEVSEGLLGCNGALVS